MKSSKVRLVGVVSILFFLVLISCEKTPIDTTVHVTDVTMNQTSLELTEGEVATLTATISPSNATNKVLLWITGNAKVATVNEGKVKAVGVGSTIITAKSDDGGYISTCKVTVSSKGAPITGLSLNKQSLVLAEGESEVLIATISPNDAVKSQLTWYSDNTPVAKVDNNGKVTALFNGTATIFVKAEGFDKTASCTVTVTKPGVNVTGVSLNKTSLSMFIGDQETLQPTVSPSNASNQSVYWSNSDPSVAEVSATGVVTAKSVGTTTITVTTEDGGKTASCLVTVQSNIISVTSVTLNKTTLNLNVDETFKLNATVKPDNATDKTVTWRSSNPTVATVSNDGLIKAVSAGNTVVSVITDDGQFSAQCTITVIPSIIHVSEVNLNKSSLSMMTGDVFTLEASVYPENADNLAVTWASDNTGVATVSNGVVTAVSAGTANIIVMAEDGGFTASCKVTVSDDITRFVSAQYLGGSMSMINDLIQYGSKLNFSVTNNSSQTIVVDYVQLIDGSTGSVGNKLTINATINGGESQGWTITIGLAGIHSPIARFTYTYRGEQYTCEAKYVEWSFPNF